MAEDGLSFFMASWAMKLVDIISESFLEAPQRFQAADSIQVMTIATHLKTASIYIESLPPYWIDPDMETTCRDILVEITSIFLWPQQFRYQQGQIVGSCAKALGRLGPRINRALTQKSVSSYFCDVRNKDRIGLLEKNCINLSKALEPSDRGEDNQPPAGFEGFAKEDNAEQSQSIIQSLNGHCQCLSDERRTETHHISWHPTRLFLDTGSGCTNFDILVSSMDMTYWQEFCLMLSSSESTSTIQKCQTSTPGHFCRFLEERTHARLSFTVQSDYSLYGVPETVNDEILQILPTARGGKSLREILRDYELKPRDRVVLSYAIAKAYWRFYDTDLMRVPWSSDIIWFMPTDENDGSDDLPVQAFVALPFGIDDNTDPDFIDDMGIYLTHRSPRVLRLGILLLELGLARPFKPVPCSTLVGQTNHNQRVAKRNLEELQRDRWSGFTHMNYFINAVKYCLDGKNFVQVGGNANNASPVCELDRRANIAKRRKKLHDNVVLPLAYLALEGFKRATDSKDPIKRKMGSERYSEVPEGVFSQPQSKGAFLSGPSTSSGGWLANLKRISGYLFKLWKQAESPITIKIAILDTGFNPEMPFYTDVDEGKRRLGIIDGWKDYVSNDKNSVQRDDFGHGSLIARLIIEICPFAKILIARVAKDTKHLPQCEGNITQAIKWAREQGADIVSMSFGIPHHNADIAREINASNDQGQKNMIFLASAGNSPDEAEAFPARLASVISIYATKSDGSFLGSNAIRPSDGSKILGTFGDDIPPEIKDEFNREYRNICKPGSSIACAVAAGIGAIMLGYVSLLPDLVEGFGESDKRTLDTIKSTKGMAAVFQLMAVEKFGDHWLTPVQFWRKHKTHGARNHALCYILSPNT